MIIHDEYAHILASITLDAWDGWTPAVRIEQLRSVYSGWFGFGHHLGYKAVISYQGIHAKSRCCRRPQEAVRDAVNHLRNRLLLVYS